MTAVTESPAAATIQVSAPAPQPEIAGERLESLAEHREQPKAQAFVAEAPGPSPAREPEPQVVKPMAIAVEPVAPAPAEYTTTSKSDPKEALSSSGLVMIETDPSRSKSYQLEEERVQLGRPRRERPKQAAEELSQVETKG